MEIFLPYLFLLGLCLALSFLFSGMEAGVFELSRLRIRQQMRRGKKQAAVLYRYLENLENFLWTILIGNTLANFAAIALIVLGLNQVLEGYVFGVLVLFLLLVFLFYAVCDLLPKMLFRLYPNRLCMGMAVPFRFIHLALAPLVGLIAWFSHRLLQLTGGKIFTGHLFRNRTELRLYMQESSHGLTSEERTMIDRVLDLQNFNVRSIAIPLSRITSVTMETTVEEAIRIFRQQTISRLPVWQSKAPQARIVGIVSLDDLLFAPKMHPEEPVAAFLKPALYLGEDMVLEEALRQMQRTGQRLAVVLGLDRRELGIVTLQDILKTIFGEITL